MKSSNQYFLDKTKRILKEHYDFDICIIKDTGDLQPKRLSKNTAHIPVNYNEKNLATIYLKSKNPISDQKIYKIFDLIEILLGYSLFIQTKKEELSNKLIQIIINKSTNIIPIKNKRQKQDFKIQNINTYKTQKKKRRIKAIKTHVFLEGINQQDMLKAALDLHCISKRYIFIHLESLQSCVKNNPDELMKLGDISIFIPELANLSNQETLSLIDLIRVNPLESPTILSGSLARPHTLQQNNQNRRQLVELLEKNHINIKKPYSFF